MKKLRQKVGTAMGTRVAPTLANIFMDNMDSKIFQLARQKYAGLLMALKRYIDDLFLLWHGSETSRQEFIFDINRIHPMIQFTASYCLKSKSVTFLDTTVTISKKKLKTDVYKKPCAKNTYLLPSSCNPNHVTQNIPYSLCLRLVRICS